MLEKLSANKFYIFLVLLLAWTLLGFFFVIQQYIYNVSNDQPFNWYNNLTYRVPNYMFWTFFTPIVYKIINKLKLIRNDLVKNISVIISSGIVLSLLHRAISVFFTFYLRQIDGRLKTDLFQALGSAKFGILGGSFDSFFVYGLIVSVIVGIVYYKRNQQSELLKSQLETKLAEAKLELLKSQLQPHFLFNTLNAVSTLMQRDVNLAEKVLTRLGDLLRLSLDGLGKNIISLKEELDFLDKYLEIQKIRFEDKIDVEFKTDSDLFDVAVPNFILQPIVENVIKHCVEKSSKRQKIVILAQKKNEELILKVEDDGPGLNENYTEGIGLRNTYDRLQHLYGERFDLSLKNNPDKGLSVTITIPLNYE